MLSKIGNLLTKASGFLPSNAMLYGLIFSFALAFGGIALHTYNSALVARGSAACEAKHSDADFQALQDAALQAERTLATRDTAIAVQAAQVAALTEELSKARNEIQSPDSVVFPASDKWLRERHNNRTARSK